MRFSLSLDKRRVGKILCYLLLLTAFYVLSDARGVLYGMGLPTVNALPFLVAAIAFFEGPYTGGCMGFYSGLLLSISSSTMEGAETLILALFGVLCGSVGVVLLRRILPSVLACGCALLAVRGAISATYYTLFYSVPFLSMAARYAQILLLSLLPGAAGYFLVRAVYRRFSEDDI